MFAHRRPSLIDFTRARPNQTARIGGPRGPNLTGVKHKHDARALSVEGGFLPVYPCLVYHIAYRKVVEIETTFILCAFYRVQSRYRDMIKVIQSVKP